MGKHQCHNCGTWGYALAKVTRNSKTRWFCHTSERSCYNERRGNYWDDNTIMTLDPAEAKVTVEDGIAHIEVTLTEEHLKHILWPEQNTRFSIAKY
jgi:hypothetical protein